MSKPVRQYTARKIPIHISRKLESALNESNEQINEVIACFTSYIDHLKSNQGKTSDEHETALLEEMAIASEKQRQVWYIVKGK